MDLVAIAQTLRRHKLAVLPVIILTSVLAVYVMVLSKPDYAAVGVYALAGPPPAPTETQIAADPALGKINPNNPLVSYGNLSIVGSMLTQALSTQDGQQRLLADGVDPRSTVTDDPTEQTPVVTVTGVGDTPAEALHSGRRLGQALTSELNSIQARLSVTPGYRVTIYPLDVPDKASLKLSSKLRDLIGVLALGMILLWVCVSIAVARTERKKASPSSASAPDSAAWQVPHQIARHSSRMPTTPLLDGPPPPRRRPRQSELVRDVAQQRSAVRDLKRSGRRDSYRLTGDVRHQPQGEPSGSGAMPRITVERGVPRLNGRADVEVDGAGNGNGSGTKRPLS